MSDPTETGNPAANPVAEAQTDASQAKAEAGKALADPQADLNQLLGSLRTIETQLYGIEVTQQVQALSDAEKQEFVAARLQLTSVINQLDTAQLGEVEGNLQQYSAELQEGIQSLQKSLNDLTGASEWAGAVNSIVSVIGQIVPLV